MSHLPWLRKQLSGVGGELGNRIASLFTMQANTTIDNIISPEGNFFEDVENHVKNSDISYIDAIVNYCEKRSIEIEQVVPLIKNNKAFKSKLNMEAIALNFLKRKK